MAEIPRSTFEVSSRRLDFFLRRFGLMHGADISRLIEKLGYDFAGLKEMIRQGSWISRSDESHLINLICTAHEAWGEVINAGASAFSHTYTEFVHYKDSELSLYDILGILPAVAATYQTGCSLQVEQPDAQTLVFSLDSHLDNTPGTVDSLFTLGLLRGMLYLFNIPSPSLQITRLAIYDDEARQLIPVAAGQKEINYCTERSVYQLNLTDKQTRILQTRSGVESDYSFDSDQLQQILQRSSELLKDKRELTTAVEYLNLANDRLEKQLNSTQKELLMAKSIQQGMLPNRLPSWHALNFGATLLAMREVSGDYFDFLNIGGGRIGVVLVDVSGHGVPAALLSVISKVAFLNHRTNDPRETFQKVNKYFIENVKGEGFLTAFYMVIQTDSRIDFSIAGMPLPLLYRKKTGKLQPYECRGSILGIFPDVAENLRNYSLELEPGDRFYVYTDGLIEGFDANDESFGSARLEQAINDSLHLPVQESVDFILERFNRHTLGMPRQDDITLIGIELHENYLRFSELIREGRKLMTMRRFKEAAHPLNDAVDIIPGHSLAQYMAAKTAAHSGDYARAIELMKRYIESKPYNADAYAIMGFSCLKTGDFEHAISHSLKALDIRPNYTQALYTLVHAYVKTGDITLARHSLKSMQASHPDFRHLASLERLFRQASGENGAE